MTRTWSRRPKAATMILASGALAFGASGCGDKEEQAYCADSNGYIVDPDRCDDNGGYGYYIWHSSAYDANMRPGQQLHGGTRIAYNDGNARAKIGLPKTGSIRSGGSGGFGSKVTVKGGGFGGAFGGGHGSSSGG